MKLKKLNNIVALFRGESLSCDGRSGPAGDETTITSVSFISALDFDSSCP